MALVVLVVATAIQAYWLRSFEPRLVTDSISYIAPARTLLAGSGFLEPQRRTWVLDADPVRPLGPGTFRTPGYPATLAVAFAAGLSIAGIVGAQHALLVALSVAIYLFTLRTTQSIGVAATAGLLHAFYLPSSATANDIMADTLFAPLFFTAFVLAYAAGRYPLAGAAAGTVAGLAALVKPIGLLYCVVIAFSLLKRRKFGAMVLCLVLAMAIDGAWIVRNHAQTGVATFCSLPGENLLFFNANATLLVSERGIAYGLFAPHTQTDFWRHIYRRFPSLFALAEARMEATRGHKAVHELNHAKWSGVYAEVGRDVILTHKGAYFVTAVSGIIGTYLDGMWETGTASLGLDLYFWKPFLIAVSAFAVLAAILGLVVLWRTDDTLCVLTILTLGFLTILSSGPASEPRLGIPIAPVFAIPVAVGLDAIRRKSLHSLRFVRARFGGIARRGEGRRASGD
ncbi:MAG: hypothetical protein QOK37_2570 [Thermoanaerobaculia bacterium]|jgi:hypothetical protein|nr:hypothetical protein [Thermoanaerobaculia bacterium]